MHAGSCLCGGVRFTVATPPLRLSFCHCAMCRKASGGGALAVAPVAVADFRLIDGAELLCDYESSPGKWRSFCRRCGSPVHSRRADKPDVLRLRIGLLDTPLPAPAQAFHIMVGSKAAWDTLPDDGLPRYEALEPDRSGPR